MSAVVNASSIAAASGPATAASSTPSASSPPLPSDNELLREHLLPFDFADEIQRARANYITGTREPILGEVDAWIGGPSSRRIFAVAGEAGLGKTCISAELTQCFGADIIAVHFCRADSASRGYATRMVKSLAYHIAQKLAMEIKELQRTIEAAIQIDVTAAQVEEEGITVLDAQEEFSREVRHLPLEWQKEASTVVLPDPTTIVITPPGPIVPFEFAEAVRKVLANKLGATSSTAHYMNNAEAPTDDDDDVDTATSHKRG